MAFFKSRKGGDEPQAASSSGLRQPAESIEAMRRRAKHRLIGASVLVLIGVVGFPLLFDTQPRPISVDIPIEIPDRNKVKPLPAPAPAPIAAASSAVTAPPAASVAKVEPPPAPKEEAKPQPQPQSEPKVAEAKPEAKPEPKAADDGTRAQALLEGKPLATTPVIAEGRFVVQVGSFSDNVKAREARQKLEHAGMKTYTQVVEKDGKRLIRVRVGPFASKGDADKAAERVKGLDLQAAVLTL